MFDHSLIRWQQDRLVRRATVVLVLAFSVVGLTPVNRGMLVTQTNKFLALGAISVALGLLGCVGLWRVFRGTGYFALSIMLVTWPLIFLFTSMCELSLRWILLSVGIVDLLFNALVPPGILVHLFWGVWQQVRQTSSD